MVVIDIYSNVAMKIKYPHRLRVSSRIAAWLGGGKDVLVKSRWRWFKPRRKLRLEPIFLCDAEEAGLRFVGVYCSPGDVADLPFHFTLLAR